MPTADNSQPPDDRVSKRVPARVNSSTRVNVALPFSQFKIEEPSDHLATLAALVGDLADVVALAVPGPEADALRSRARQLASQLR
jgi:hypothetical protein